MLRANPASNSGDRAPFCTLVERCPVLLTWLRGAPAGTHTGTVTATGPGGTTTTPVELAVAANGGSGVSRLMIDPSAYSTVTVSFPALGLTRTLAWPVATDASQLPE